MRLVWHMISADARKHRGLLTAWFLLIVVGAAAATLIPTLDLTLGQRQAVDLAKTLSGVVGVVLGTLLTALVVQGHSPVGSQAFWLTRPFPIWVVLTAKAALLLAVLAAMPVAAEIGRMLAGRMPISSVPDSVGLLALTMTTWLVLAAAPAAVTRSVAGYAVVVVGGVALVIAATAIGIAIETARAQGDVAFVAESPASSGDAQLVFILLTCLAAVGVVGTQFLTRSRMWSVPVGLALLLTAWIAADHWRWSYFWSGPAIPGWATDATRAHLTVAPDDIRTRGRSIGNWMSRPSETAWRNIDGRLRVTGVEATWLVQISLIEASVTLPSGEVLRSPVGNGSMPRFDGVDSEPTTEAVRAALGVERLFEPVAPLNDSQTLHVIKDDDLDRIAPANGSYNGRYRVVPVHYSVETALPLHVGATRDLGVYRIEVLEVRMSDELHMRVRTSAANATGNQAYYLRNRSRGEAIEGSVVQLISGFTVPFGFELPGYSSQQLALMFPKGDRTNPTVQPAFALDREWLSGAELAVVRAEWAGTFERTLKIADFPIRPAHPDDRGLTIVEQ